MTITLGQDSSVLGHVMGGGEGADEDDHYFDSLLLLKVNYEIRQKKPIIAIVHPFNSTHLSVVYSICQSYQCGALRVLLVDFLSLSQQLLNVSKHAPLC